MFNHGLTIVNTICILIFMGIVLLLVQHANIIVASIATIILFFLNPIIGSIVANNEKKDNK